MGYTMKQNLEQKEESKTKTESKEEEKEVPIDLVKDFKETMDTMIKYLQTTDPKKLAELEDVYELLKNYKKDPENYFSVEIPIDYYIKTQKEADWFKRHMDNIRAVEEQAKQEGKVDKPPVPELPH
eukprot:TRINITY_DN99_c0_g1_i16.p1 TRINITY_DN99_c0_g1~~TRINITY_DN99_c0_g1_i16.p1  ORF type:complete len:126 (-),score=66.27 TRINITY_DN99_c0_g1_i16:27-404(-)